MVPTVQHPYLSIATLYCKPSYPLENLDDDHQIGGAFGSHLGFAVVDLFSVAVR